MMKENGWRYLLERTISRSRSRLLAVVVESRHVIGYREPVDLLEQRGALHRQAELVRHRLRQLDILRRERVGVPAPDVQDSQERVALHDGQAHA